MIRHLCNSYSVKVIFATMSTGNNASKSLAKKVGMKYRKTIKNGDQLPNGLRKELVFEMEV